MEERAITVVASLSVILSFARSLPLSFSPSFSWKGITSDPCTAEFVEPRDEVAHGTTERVGIR